MEANDHERVMDELCESLIRNEASTNVMTLYAEDRDDDEIRRICTALRQNTTIESFIFTSRIRENENRGGELRIGVLLPMIEVISEHPKAKSVSVWGMGSIEGLSAMALAFRQNKNLLSLNLTDCALSRAQMETLDFLLLNGSLEKLEMYYCFPEDSTLHLPCLGSNKSLRYLTIDSSDDYDDWTLSDKTLLAIPRLLKGNRGLHTLLLSNFDLPFDVLEQITQAVGGHKSLEKLELVNTGLDGRDAGMAIGRMLESNSSLKTMDASFNDLGDAGVVAVCMSLKYNTSLKELDLGSNSSGGAVGAMAVGQLIEEHDASALKRIDLYDYHISNTGAMVLAKGLRNNHTLEELVLYDSDIGASGANALAESIRHNKMLKWLDLSDNPIGDSGAKSFAEALAINTTLETLEIGSFGEDGLNAIAKNLPNMNGLRHLVFHHLRHLTSQSVNACLKALERNTELEEGITVESSHVSSSETANLVETLQAKAKYQGILNRAGKRILKSESHIPLGLWPLVLERSRNSPDALFYFLREKPDVLINKVLVIDVAPDQVCWMRLLVSWLVELIVVVGVSRILLVMFLDVRGTS